MNSSIVRLLSVLALPLASACTLLPIVGPCDAGDGGCSEPCMPGSSRLCYPGPPGTMTHPPCRPGLQSCDTMGNWGLCLGATLPVPEMCNDVDDDCDGVPDNCDPGLVCVPTLMGRMCCTRPMPGRCADTGACDAHPGTPNCRPTALLDMSTCCR